jgi:lysophospholipase L1-like esterase
MRFWIPLLSLLLIGATSPQPTVTLDPERKLVTQAMRELPVRPGGRIIAEPIGDLPQKRAMRYTHQWPAVYFEAAFEGDYIVARFDDDANDYRLWIDDREPIAVTRPGQSDVRISGLSSGPHLLRLEKVTESADKAGAFGGFYIPKSARPLTVPARQRQIEFVGDSDMTGYGIHSPTRQCTQDEVRQRTDAQMAYPALVAKHFNADYQVNAIAGRGMVRNYNGTLPGDALPMVYPFVRLNKTVPYFDRAWQPQIVLIGLGSNDFSTSLKPGEPWAGNRELIASYFSEYERFLGHLHPRNRNASLIMLRPGFPDTTPQETLALVDQGQKQLAASARSIGFRSAEFVAMPDLKTDISACDYHWSLSDHAKVSKWLIGYLQTRPDIWVKK